MQDPCVYCGGVPKGLDHIVASTRGGTDGWENRAPACASCDQDKGNASLLFFLLAERLAVVRASRRTRYGNNELRRRAGVVGIRNQILKASIAERVAVIF